MRKVKLIGKMFPTHLKGVIVDIEYDGIGYKTEAYVIKSKPHNGLRLHNIPEWDILEVDKFNEYLKLIKQ